MINFRATAATAALLCFTAFAASPASADGEVNVYTYRETKLIQPLFDAFTKDTGIKVNVVSASSGLEQRMKAEGANSPADVLLTVDIGRIDEAVQAGVTQPIKSVVIDEIVPEPAEGAHTDLDATARAVGAALIRQLRELLPVESQPLLEQRYARYRKFVGRGKNRQKVVTALGRELLGFIWAIIPPERLDASLGRRWRVFNEREMARS